MITHAILDTNHLKSPNHLSISTLYVPIPILEEIKTPQLQTNFQNLKLTTKIIYTTHSYNTNNNNLLDKESELIILDPAYIYLATSLAEYLNTKCSTADILVAATSIFVESTRNNNTILFELVDSAFNKDSKEVQCLVNQYIKEVEVSKFGEWKSIKNDSSELNITKVLTQDAGINSILAHLQLNNLLMDRFREKKFVLRCFTCRKIYQNIESELIFCKKCGNNSISRVSVRRDADGRLLLNLKEGFKYKKQVVKDRDGKEIMSEDCRQFRFYKSDRKYKK